MNTHEKFLSFNGKNIVFLNKDGQYWIAIKPICEALEIEYTRQFKNLKKDEILFQLLAKQPIVGADKKLRKMICLPEKFIYGWLFSIKSDSKELTDYKRTCYELLYNHFHGIITSRKELLLNKLEVDSKIYEIKEELQETNEKFKELELLEKQRKSINKNLKEIDKDLIEQPKLF